MKKFYFVNIIIVLILTFFLLPLDISIKFSTYLHKNIENPIKEHFCMLQKSTPSYIFTFGDLVPNTSCFINEAILKKKIKNGLPRWAKQQIQEDLSTFKTIHSTDLDQFLKENNDGNNCWVHFKIINRKVHVLTPTKNCTLIFNGTYKAIYYVLQYLAENNYISNTDLILGPRDFVSIPSTSPVPIFAFAKDLAIKTEKDAILIPDWQNLSSVNNFRTRITKAKRLYPWENKQDVLFWRGGTFDSTGLREKLVSLAPRYPNLIDAKFNSKDVKIVDPEDHLKYKYLISIDGARCAWERLIWHLHSNSLTFKNESTQVQWFYKGIAPYVHYIPIQNEASLLTALDWAKTHPIEVQSTIENASKFVEENLALEDMYHYFIVLLQEYTKKLKMD